MALGLKLTALRAGIRKEAGPHTFRMMKVRDFQESGAKPDVVFNALGWTREFGMAPGNGHRAPWETLEKAALVLGDRGSDVERPKRGWIERVVEWVLL
jgi:hypothetical protein